MRVSSVLCKLALKPASTWLFALARTLLIVGHSDANDKNVARIPSSLFSARPDFLISPWLACVSLIECPCVFYYVPSQTENRKLEAKRNETPCVFFLSSVFTNFTKLFMKRNQLSFFSLANFFRGIFLRDICRWDNSWTVCNSGMIGNGNQSWNNPQTLQKERKAERAQEIICIQLWK